MVNRLVGIVDASSQRVALVTGAGRGIGAATVAALCAQDYLVVALDACAGDASGSGADYPLATRADLDAAVAAFPGRASAYMADVRDPQQLAGAVRTTLDRHGRLDAVVAAAGVIAGGTPLWETSDQVFHDQWQTNAAGVWNTAKATIPAFLDGPSPAGCRFVAVASAAGSRGLFHLSAYNASKHAVIGIVRGLAADLIGTGVTAVAVSPGSTDTSMLAATADLYGIGDPSELAASQLLRRTIDPSEMAATIAFCCSVAGGILNGSVVAADGGFAG